MSVYLLKYGVSGLPAAREDIRISRSTSRNAQYVDDKTNGTSIVGQIYVADLVLYSCFLMGKPSAPTQSIQDECFAQ